MGEKGYCLEPKNDQESPWRPITVSLALTARAACAALLLATSSRPGNESNPQHRRRQHILIRIYFQHVLQVDSDHAVATILPLLEQRAGVWGTATFEYPKLFR